MRRHKTTPMSGRDAPFASDMIRVAIDCGLDGDKIAHPDTAAAPFGADAVSAGTPPTREERAMAARQSRSPRYVEDPAPPDGGAISSWKTGLIIFTLTLVAGALLVSLRLHQLSSRPSG